MNQSQQTSLESDLVFVLGETLFNQCVDCFLDARDKETAYAKILVDIVAPNIETINENSTKLHNEETLSRALVEILSEIRDTIAQDFFSESTATLMYAVRFH